MLVRYSADCSGKLVKKAVVYTREEHGIDAEKIDPDAFRIITHLRSSGFGAYLVGGAVRDLILGKKPKDFDIVTDATPQRLKKLFRNSRLIGKRFRLVHIFFGDKIFEVSTFRSLADGTVGNSFGSMDEDVQRRDFTLNALYYDPLRAQIIDYVNGIKDIKKRRIEPVIPLRHIFSDDPVRMIRAVKYAASAEFHLPFLVKRKISKNVHLLGSVSASRLTEELVKILHSGCAERIISMAVETGIFMYLQPAACSLIYDDPKFAAAYFNRLAALDRLHEENPGAPLGERLYYFIADFIERLTDWKKEVEEKTAPSELYGNTWRECRSFVLPMNPPRVELEFAVRYALKQLGVPIRIQKKQQRTVGFSSRNGRPRTEQR